MWMIHVDAVNENIEFDVPKETLLVLSCIIVQSEIHTSDEEDALFRMIT